MPHQQLRSHWKDNVLNFYEEVNGSDYRTGVWADCPLLAIEADPSLGYIVFEDFTQFPLITDADAPTLSGWTCTQGGNTKGLLRLLTGTTGILEVDSESTTQHEGLHIQQAIAHFKCAAGKDIWYETRLKVLETYATVQLWAGLSKIDGTLIKNDGDLDTTSDYIGFGMETGAAGAIKFYECVGGAELSDSVVTCAENTYIRLGFHIDGITGVHCFVNGAEVALTTVVYTGLPVDDALTLGFTCQTEGTEDPMLHVDWVRCVQLR